MKSLYYLSMDQHAAHFRKNDLDASRILPNEDYHTRETYHPDHSLIRKDVRKVSKFSFSFVKVVFDVEHQHGVSGRYLLLRAELNPISLMRRLLSKFLPRKKLILAYCIWSEPTAKASMLVVTDFNYSECKGGHTFLSKATHPILGVFACQGLNVASDVIAKEKIQ